MSDTVANVIAFAPANTPKANGSTDTPLEQARGADPDNEDFCPVTPAVTNSPRSRLVWRALKRLFFWGTGISETKDLELYARHFARLGAVMAEASEVSCGLMAETLAVFAGEKQDLARDVLTALNTRAAKVFDDACALELEAIRSQDVLRPEMMKRLDGLLQAIWDDTFLSLRFGLEKWLLWPSIGCQSRFIEKALGEALPIVADALAVGWGREFDLNQPARIGLLYRHLFASYQLARGINLETEALYQAGDPNRLRLAVPKIKGWITELSANAHALHQTAQEVGDTPRARSQKAELINARGALAIRRGSALLDLYHASWRINEQLLAQQVSSNPEREGLVTQAVLDRTYRRKQAPADRCLAGIEALCAVGAQLYTHCNGWDNCDRCTCPTRIRFTGRETNVQVASLIYQAIGGALRSEARKLRERPAYQHLDAKPKRGVIEACIAADAERLCSWLKLLADDRGQLCSDAVPRRNSQLFKGAEQ